jgi:hypothetical protein
VAFAADASVTDCAAKPHRLDYLTAKSLDSIAEGIIKSLGSPARADPTGASTPCDRGWVRSRFVAFAANDSVEASRAEP